MRKRSSSKQPPDRPILLLTRVVAGDEKAWHQFVECYAGFVYSLAWRYARHDVDVASDLFLAVLEGLRREDSEGREFYRLRQYLQSIERYEGQSRFVTWLALVAKNLFRDWFREQGGRRILPKEIEGLDPMDQELFRLVFWEGHSEREAFEKMKTAGHAACSDEEFEKHLAHVYTRLSQRNFWTIYQDLLRRIPAVGLGSRSPSGNGRPLDVADTRNEVRPDVWMELVEDRALAEDVGKVLHQAVEALPTSTRNVILAMVVHGLSGEECRRLMGFDKRQQVYDEMAKARRKIKSHLSQVGIAPGKLLQVAQLLDGWLGAEVDIEIKS